MKIKDYKCKKCGRDNFFLEHSGPHFGIHCSYCGMWYKWADKSEVALFYRRLTNEHKDNKTT